VLYGAWPNVDKNCENGRRFAIRRSAKNVPNPGKPCGAGFLEQDEPQVAGMKTIRQAWVGELDEDPFNARAMMENNWGQISDERKARWERRHAWRERPLRWPGKCNRKEQYENEHADR
jgi:hypothetical protein